MMASDFKMAMRALATSKWRSFLTMLGVFIGVISVVTIISLGEGVRQQVSRQITNQGDDLITIRPGRIVERDDNGSITDVDWIKVVSTNTFSNQDIDVVATNDALSDVTPLGLINGVPSYEDTQYAGALIVGTNSNFPKVTTKNIKYGTFFSSNENGSPVAVIGHLVAEELFGEVSPIGKSFVLRGRSIIVRGVIEDFEVNPLNPGFDYNAAIFIPYGFASELSDGAMQNYQILARPAEGVSVDDAVDKLSKAFLKAHSGQEDFTILKPGDNIALASTVLQLMTAMVAGIAAISLLVGGIGIMNIMLVSVSERTHEIGIRKSIGATDTQILGQFFIEAVVLSSLGGLLGILGSLGANYGIRMVSDLEPAVDFRIMGIAFLVAIIVGSVFGIVPAFKAARKDPIYALKILN